MVSYFCPLTVQHYVAVRFFCYFTFENIRLDIVRLKYMNTQERVKIHVWL